MKNKKQNAVCKRADRGIITVYFDKQEGKYIVTPCPVPQDWAKAEQLDSNGNRYEEVASIFLDNDEHGYPKPGKQIDLLNQSR